MWTWKPWKFLLPSFAKEQQLSQKNVWFFFGHGTPYFARLSNHDRFDVFPNGTDFPIFGGTKGKHHRGILPTGETVQFLLAGKQPQRKDCLQFLFWGRPPFLYQGTRGLDSVPEGEPLMSGKLLLFPRGCAPFWSLGRFLLQLSNRLSSRALGHLLTWGRFGVESQTEKIYQPNWNLVVSQ